MAYICLLTQEFSTDVVVGHLFFKKKHIVKHQVASETTTFILCQQSTTFILFFRNLLEYFLHNQLLTLLCKVNGPTWGCLVHRWCWCWRFGGCWWPSGEVRPCIFLACQHQTLLHFPWSSCTSVVITIIIIIFTTLVPIIELFWSLTCSASIANGASKYTYCPPPPKLMEFLPHADKKTKTKNKE